MLLEKYDSFNDLRFLVDQLTNSMENYDEESFVEHLGKETKYNKDLLRKIFKAYWELNPQSRNDYDTNDWTKWIENLDEPECYIDYLNSKNNFRETRKDFSSYEDAKKWIMGNFEKWDIDMIKYY